MDTIKFELKTDLGQHTVAEISLNGATIDNYLTAFKSFLIACSFTEASVEEIQFVEDVLVAYQNENKEN